MIKIQNKMLNADQMYLKYKKTISVLFLLNWNHLKYFSNALNKINLYLI